ncbi:MAG: MFS transporter [Candidatus Bathyarchaeota archaeon]|nr:MAG: MFS transporter [Candidatus Bathyarchaeota archaeon]
MSGLPEPETEIQSAVPPGRKTLLNISSFQILAMFRRGLFYTYVSIYLKNFLGLSVTETTFFATFPMIMNVLFQTFIWGTVSDRFQLRRTLIVVGELSAALSTLVVWFLHTLPESNQVTGYVIIVGLSIVEIFWSMSNVGWSALLSDLYPPRERAGIQGRLSSIGAVGRIIGIWVGGLAYDGLGQFYEGWGFDQGLLFFIASAVMIGSTVPMFFAPEGGIVKSPVPRRDKRREKHDLSRLFLVFLIAMIFINFGRNSVAVVQSQYLSLDEGFNVSSSLLSYITNTASVAILMVGLFVRRMSERFNDKTLLLAGSALAIASLLGVALANDLGTIFLSSFMRGASDVIVLATSYSFVSKLIPRGSRGRQFALFNATLFLSWGLPGTLIVGPLIDGLIGSGVSQVFSYRMGFIAATILVSIGVLILMFVHNTHPKTGKSWR